MRRNTGKRGYRHKQAGSFTRDRHKNKAKAVKLDAFIKLLINDYLSEDYSPEQIAGKLNKDGVIALHHETIYQYILSDKASGGLLYKHLDTKEKPTERDMVQQITEQRFLIA